MDLHQTAVILRGGVGGVPIGGIIPAMELINPLTSDHCNTTI